MGCPLHPGRQWSDVSKIWGDISKIWGHWDISSTLPTPGHVPSHPDPAPNSHPDSSSSIPNPGHGNAERSSPRSRNYFGAVSRTSGELQGIRAGQGHLRNAESFPNSGSPSPDPPHPGLFSVVTCPAPLGIIPVFLGSGFLRYARSTGKVLGTRIPLGKGFGVGLGSGRREGRDGIEGEMNILALGCWIPGWMGFGEIWDRGRHPWGGI